jgi:hypothetical protein
LLCGKVVDDVSSNAGNIFRVFISRGLVDTLWESLGVTHQVNLNLDHCVLTDCDLNGNRFVWVGLWHPTRNWSTINQPYFRDTVVPAITMARKRALKLAQTV